MTRHIRADKLARYRAGDLGARESARVRAHLDGCARCTAAADDLAAVSTILASVPAPPMPEDVTARIEAALAAEAASRAASPAVPAARGPVPAAPGRDGVTRRAAMRSPQILSRGWLRSPVTLRVAAGAAAAVVILGGGFAAIRLAGSSGTAARSSSSTTEGSGTSAGGSGAAGATAQSPNAAAPAAVPAPMFTYQARGRPRPFTVLTSSADLGPGNLAREVGQLILGERTGAQHDAKASPRPSAPRSALSGIPGFAPAKIEACVTRVADGGRVRLVQTGRYQGQQALIIAVSPAGGGPVRIWVVGTGCSATSSDVITQMALPGAG
jgi:putative zinc finger protein